MSKTEAFTNLLITLITLVPISALVLYSLRRAAGILYWRTLIAAIALISLTLGLILYFTLSLFLSDR